ncbi:ribosome-binding factor A [bacterium]|nr:ribosome-binding factor A [bacterium]
MSLSLRQQKVASLWQQMLATLLVDELTTRSTACTIYAVIPTADLKHAEVRISAVGPDGAAVVEKLNAQRGAWSRALASKLESKFSPRLNFVFDQTEEKAFEIEQMIKGLNE